MLSRILNRIPGAWFVRLMIAMGLECWAYIIIFLGLGTGQMMWLLRETTNPELLALSAVSHVFSSLIAFAIFFIRGVYLSIHRPELFASKQPT